MRATRRYLIVNLFRLSNWFFAFVGAGQRRMFAHDERRGLSIDVGSAIAWRSKMQDVTIHSIKTMHYLPRLRPA